MAYPNTPENRLIVGGVDLFEKFKMVLVDGYTSNPPEPKTYTVDIPGGNSVLDLTDALLGDCAYEIRQQEFTFYIIDVADFEKAKTEINNFLHGKAFDYVWTKDPEYTYHGRFFVSECGHEKYANVNVVGHMKVTVSSNPFKHKPTQLRRAAALGGNIYVFESGRERVRPIFETDGFLRVIFDGKKITVGQGTYQFHDVNFQQGENEVYLNSYEIHNCTWGNLKTNTVTWKKFKEKKLFEWYKSNGSGTIVFVRWIDWESNVWEEYKTKTWDSLLYDKEITKDIKDIFIKYEWGDL